jgi:hypothetical protein
MTAEVMKWVIGLLAIISTIFIVACLIILPLVRFFRRDNDDNWPGGPGFVG